MDRSGKIDKVMENFHKGPNVTEAAKVGEPTLVDPKQASAPDMVRAANSSVMGSLSNLNGTNQVTVEQVGNGAPPPANAPGSTVRRGAGAQLAVRERSAGRRKHEQHRRS